MCEEEFKKWWLQALDTEDLLRKGLEAWFWQQEINSIFMCNFLKCGSNINQRNHPADFASPTKRDGNHAGLIKRNP